MTALHIAPTLSAQLETIKAIAGVLIHLAQPEAVMVQLIEPTPLVQPETIKATLGVPIRLVTLEVAMAQLVVQTLLVPCVAIST